MKTYKEIFELYRTMSSNNIVLIYQGLFDQEIVKSVIAVTEKKMLSENVNEIVVKKMFNILVECLQNICKHTQQAENIEETPFLMITREMNTLNIVTGNLIEKPAIEKVRGKIDHINNLNTDQLKEYYKEARIKSTISEVGGAGLGFIDMARKSGNKLEYRFYDVNDQFSYFILNNTINYN
ncbi:MAG: SiaB family protein kinase [Bacteroidia bacterium]